MEIRRIGSSGSYYRQSAEIKGVSIKAASGVAPEAIQTVARVVNVMLDGREDLRQCIEGSAPSFVVRKRGHGNLGIPEFRTLRVRDIWGRAYEELHGWGGTPYKPTMVSENSLLGETAYRPEDVAVHEFAHTIMNLCFDHSTRQELDALYASAVSARLGFGIDIMLDRSEFFAEFSSIYFDAHTDFPRRALIEKLPDMHQFLEGVYGELTAHDSDRLGHVRYTTQSGIPVPWTASSSTSYEDPTTRVYEDPDVRYSIEIPKGWELTAQESDSVHWAHLAGRSITGRFNLAFWELRNEFALTRSVITEFGDTWNRDYELRHADWEEFVQLSSRVTEVEGIIWVISDYYGFESADTCPVNIRSQIGVITHRDIQYGTVLLMSLCESETDFEVQWNQLSHGFAVAAHDLK